MLSPVPNVKGRGTRTTSEASFFTAVSRWSVAIRNTYVSWFCVDSEINVNSRPGLDSNSASAGDMLTKDMGKKRHPGCTRIR